jgi:hypothetical protein
VAVVDDTVNPTKSPVAAALTAAAAAVESTNLAVTSLIFILLSS